MSKFLKWLLPDHVNGWSYDWGGRLWFTCHFSGNKDITRINLSSFPVFQASQLSSSFTS